MKLTDTLRLDSPLGRMLLTATPQGVSGAWFEGQRHEPSEVDMQNWPTNAANPLFQETKNQLLAYLAGKLSKFHWPLELSAGTPFQKSVWQAWLSVPASQTRSYGDLAKQLGKPCVLYTAGCV